MIGVTATGDRVLVDATGPNPAPDLAMLRQDLDAASLGGLDVRISLVTVSYQPCDVPGCQVSWDLVSPSCEGWIQGLVTGRQVTGRQAG